jgi:Concanavalin A-like lectin/glucanases superfamily
MEAGAAACGRSMVITISREGGQNMSKRFLITLLLIIGFVAGNVTASLVPIDPATVQNGHVYLSEGVSGTQLPDDSANSNAGTIVGGPEIVEGLSGEALQFDGVDDIVRIPDSANINTTGPFANRTVIVVFKCDDVSKAGKQVLFDEGGRTRGAIIYVFEGRIYVGAWNRAEYNWNGEWLSAPIGSDEWHAVALVIRDAAAAVEDDKFEMWLDGDLIAKAPGGLLNAHADDNGIGGTNQNAVYHDDGGSGSDIDFFGGVIDEVWILNDALTPEQLGAIGLSRTNAGNPIPANGATDVLRDGILAWDAGEFARTHDVYFGTAFADVNDARRVSPTDTLASQGQTDISYDPGRLEFGVTYYWRIDEVNGAPDSTIFKGEVWSFTAEPAAYAIGNIAATTSGISDAGIGPENLVNGFGLNAAGEHSIEATDMWLATLGADPLVLQFDFEQVYKLHEMLIWNYNVMFEPMLGFGVKDVTVEYSENGVDWAVLGDVEFAQGTAVSGYTANTAVDFGGVAVQFVRLTVNSGYGPLGQFGLSEVQFMYIPVQAREPQPADGKTDVDVNTVLNWRAGREAATHEVYLSTDSEAVSTGAALVDTVSTNSYASDDLAFGTAYYWKIDEVNEAEAISVWGSDVWTFRTLEFATIDDFESYDDEENLIYETWIDGWVNETGSTVGYLEAPFAETSIVNSGAQSMPLQYDNGAAPFYSETEYDLGGMDLGTNGADTLRLFVAGQAPAFFEGADGSLLMNGIGNDIWGTADQFRYAHMNLSGDGSMTARVDYLDESPDVWVKAGVMIRQSTEAGAINTFIAMTGSGGGGATFQQRVAADDVSVSQHTYAGNPFVPPYWVRLERAGSTFSAFISPDGETWQQAGDTVTVAMTDPALIGLALTSHNVNQATSAEFSNISTTGNVTGSWQVAEIGAVQPVGSDVETVYVAVEDSAGHVAVVTHPDAAVRSGWTEWLIPLSDLAGINLNSVRTMYIGVGDRNNPSSGGAGLIFIDDIGFGKPATASQ